MEEISTSVLSMRISAAGQVGQKAGHSSLLQEVDQADQHNVRVAPVPCLDQAAHGIENHDFRLKLLNDLVNDRQVHLQAVERRPAGMEAKQILLGPLREVQADGPHIANQLPG